MGQCEYRFMCGEENCERSLEDCRKLLVDKLMEQGDAMKRLKERYQKEIVAVKEAEEEPAVHFVCDRRNCGSCQDDCRGYTTNSRHAANFHLEGTEFFEDG